MAFKNGNEKAVDYMIDYGIIKHKKELDAEMLNSDEELGS